MATYIVYALLLAIIQIWVVPAAFNLKIFHGIQPIEMNQCLRHLSWQAGL